MDVKEALDMYERYKTFWSDNYREAKTDLRFVIGKDQWEDEDVQARRRAGKVSLVINQLPQFVHQVTNDIRQNTPSVKVIPEADGDEETAEMLAGLVRSIEYKSAADEIYDTAAEYAVKCSIGFIRVDHDYIDDETDEQEIVLKRVPDPLSVWLDPASIECDGRDACGAICLEVISDTEFKRLYPGKKMQSFTDPKNSDNLEKQDSIVLAEIFVKEYVGKRGKKAVVKRYKFSGAEKLAETTFPGGYIPIVPVFGEETWVDGKRILQSLVRQARDPQRRVNHWASKEAELLSMAPIAPVMAVQGTLVNDRGQWQSPGSEMVLEYNPRDLDGNPADKPERLQPPPIPTGIINAMQEAKQDIKEAMGLYNASLGNKSNETSGVAIEKRQREGDTATFHFADNTRRAINQVGRVILDMIPIIYDTPRILQIIGEESETKMVGVNGAQPMPEQKAMYDLTRGKYHVRVTTGASYTTKRQEAAELFGDVLKAQPELMGVIGDLWAKTLDVAGAEAMAERIKKTINPALLEGEGEQQAPSPKEMQMAQMLEQAQAQMQQMAAELQKVNIEREKLELEREKLAIESRKVDIEAFQAKAEVLAPAMPQEPKESPEKQMLDPDMPEEAILAVLQDKKNQALMAQEQEAMKAQAEQEEKQREMEMEQYELQLKEQEIAVSQQNTQAILQGMGALMEQINMLTQSVNRPKQVMRDPETGAIVGVQ